MPKDRLSRLVSKTHLEAGHVLLTFQHAEVAASAQAGQFVMMKAGSSPEPPLRRPFSILGRDASSGSFTVYVRVVGGGSAALAGLELGGEALCLGPLGQGFSLPGRGEEALLVGGGYGIAPFYLFAQELRAAGFTPRIFYGGRRAADLQLLSLLETLGVPVSPATEDGSLGHAGRITLALEAYLAGSAAPARLYGCGPDAMLHALARLASDRSLPCQVSLDPWMGCGVGTCLSCVVRIQRAGERGPHYRCACTEGPVFDASTVLWSERSLSRAEEVLS